MVQPPPPTLPPISVQKHQKRVFSKTAGNNKQPEGAKPNILCRKQRRPLRGHFLSPVRARGGDSCSAADIRAAALCTCSVQRLSGISIQTICLLLFTAALIESLLTHPVPASPLLPWDGQLATALEIEVGYEGRNISSCLSLIFAWNACFPAFCQVQTSS